MLHFFAAHLLPLVGLVSTIPLSTCYSLADGGELIAGNVLASEGPYNIALDQGFMVHPDSTKSVKVPLSFTGTTPPTSQWTLGIELILDVSVPNSHDVTQLTLLSLQGPDSAAADTAKNDTTHNLCTVIFTGLSANTTAAAQKTDLDGDCTPTLSDECRQDLASAVLAHFALSGQCGITLLPVSCDVYFPDDFSHKPSGNATAHNLAETNVWAVIFAWSEDIATTNSSTLRCIRAADASSERANNAGDETTGTPGAGAKLTSLRVRWLVSAVMVLSYVY